MEYNSYSEYDLHLLFSEIREVSDRPYMLHAAFLLSCLYEAYTPDEDEEEQPAPEYTWGWAIPQSVLKSIVKNANEQFIEAAKNGTQIDIWDRGYSIRKARECDITRLQDIFQFPVIEDNFLVCKEGVMNLAESVKENSYDQTKKEYNDSKIYLRKVIMTAEDDNNNGWDSLTDMEVTMYLWAIFYQKCKIENQQCFRDKFKKDLYTTSEQDMQCWNDIAQKAGKPKGLYTFSADKVRAWNSQHKQTSIIDQVDDEAANDYWFNVAAKMSDK